MSEWRSRVVTQGLESAPHRAMLRAVGFGDADFEKPIVGIANAYSNLTPCNASLDVLAARAMEALKAAGAMPQVFVAWCRQASQEGQEIMGLDVPPF